MAGAVVALLQGLSGHVPFQLDRELRRGQRTCMLLLTVVPPAPSTAPAPRRHWTDAIK